MAKNIKPSNPGPDDMTHPALRVMACTLDNYSYSSLHAIYSQYRLRITPLESEVSRWLSDGVLQGDQVRNYNWSASVTVAAKRWADILREVSVEEFERLSKSGEYAEFNRERSSRIGLSRAFCRYLHGQPFQQQLDAVNWGDVRTESPRVWNVVYELCMQEEYAGFTSCLDVSVLRSLFLEEFIAPTTEELANPDAEKREVAKQLFFENEHLDELARTDFRDTYLYAVELLKTGRIDDLLARVNPAGTQHRRLLALKALHEGKPDEAYVIFRDDLKRLGWECYDDSLTNFAYGLALGLAGSQQAATRAVALMKSRKLKDCPVARNLLLGLHILVGGDALSWLDKSNIMRPVNRMDDTLFVLLGLHYDLFEDRPWFRASFNGEYVAQSDFRYLQLICSDDFEALRPRRQWLREQTGLPGGLLPPKVVMPKWERVIDQLLKLHSPKGTKKSAAKDGRLDRERVVYLVNLDELRVQPRLQKSKDGGITWSNGRNIALKTFGNGNQPYMTPQDLKVSRLVVCYYDDWEGRDTYELEGVEAVAALVGCTNVYDEITGQPLDLVDEPLQLVVDERRGGYAVKSNVDVADVSHGLYLQRIGDKQVNVTSVSAEQKETLASLAEVGVFPAESRAQLTQLLQTLSQSFTVMSPLLKNAEELRRVKASALIVVQLAPSEGMHYAVALAVKPFDTHPPYCRPALGMEVVSTTIDGERLQTERDMKAERANLKAVRGLMKDFDDESDDNDHWVLDTEQTLTLLDRLRTASDVCCVEWPKGSKMRVARPMLTSDSLHLKVRSAGQWFEVEGEVNIGLEEKIKVSQMLEMVRGRNSNFVRLGDDEYVALSEQLRKQLQLLDRMASVKGDQLKLATVNAPLLSGLKDEGGVFDCDDSFLKLDERIREAARLDFPVPANIHAELRPYQQEGFVWMSRLAWWGAGACLADDMGLGKTLQAITLLQSRAAQGPQMVVMPTSVQSNWADELRRFAPALRVLSLNQAGGNRKKTVAGAAEGDVVLATYGLLVTEGKLLASRHWVSVVLDEAHAIKNRDTQTSHAAMALEADFRLLLTGTPLQNHLAEIWNLFRFATPGLLGSFQQFSERFVIPIERDHDRASQRMLKRLLSPFMLRRTKEDVLNELPEKTEITIRVDLGDDERALYDNLRELAVANLEEGNKSPLQALAEITKLRLAACHPRLINPSLPLASSKTVRFLQLVDDLRSNGHRALVFSQFTSHLALVRESLDRQQTPYLYLDGSTAPKERARLVKEFQTGDAPLFLISLKAGGLGLNLTAADYVIHLDPWWNPAIEDQASDRAHRIGQERPVTVYRLISAGTIEEKILRLHGEKRSMADALLQDANLFTRLSADDIIRLLRENA